MVDQTALEVLSLETILKIKISVKQKLAYNNLSKLFLSKDRQGLGEVSPNDFEECLQKVGVYLSRDEKNALSRHFDNKGNRSVDYNAFLGNLLEPLNERRLAMVRRCFNLVDTDNTGSISYDALKSKYSARDHPDVVSGKKKQDQVLSELLAAFEGPQGTSNGTISAEEFERYYTEVSMGIHNDEYFVEMLSLSYLTLETDDMTQIDQSIVNKCLASLRNGLKLKISPKVTLEEGIKLIFQQFDSNGSGVIDLDELYNLCGIIGVPVERKYIMRIIRALDTDNSGTISLEELSYYITGQKQI